MRIPTPHSCRSLAFTIAIAMVHFTHAQSSDTTNSSVYRVRWGVDIPITAVAFTTNFLGLQMVGDKTPLTLQQVEALDPDEVGSFDRGATRQDASFSSQANTISDWLMNITLASPGVLMFDRRIRPQGLRLLVMYMETEAIVGNLYSFGAANWVDRTRPFVYNPNEDIARKLEPGARNSFYSGHTASTACATFFMAKVYSDHHPELGNKKYLYYGLALVPPAVTGYLRYKAGKHFPTDIITGGVVGAATGILIPQLHKRRKNGHELGMVPQLGDLWGFSAYYSY